MKKQTLENVSGGERILLYENKTAINFQSNFISTLATMFNDLIAAFNALELDDVEFEHSDLQEFGVYRANALSFIKSKVASTIKDPKIAGKKTTPEKIVGMMDIDPGSFTPHFDAINSYINIQLQTAGRLGVDIAIEYNSTFFDLKEGQISINNVALGEWYDKRCRKFVESNKQLEAYNTVKPIADALNTLKTTGNRSVHAVDTLQRNPRHYTSDWLGRLIVFDEGTNSFIVNHDFVTRH